METSRAYLRWLVLTMVASVQAGCADTGPEPDTTVYGYVTVFIAPVSGDPNSRRELLLLRNGDQEIELVSNDTTQWINTANRNGGQSIDFDSVYRAVGVLNYVPDSMRDEAGKVTRVGFANTDWIWLARIERLSEEETESRLADGTVQPKT